MTGETEDMANKAPRREAGRVDCLKEEIIA